MLVLHLIDADEVYGAERIVLDLMLHQRKQGLNAVLGSIGGVATREKPIEAEARQLGLNVRKFPMRRGLNLVGGLRILRHARQNAVELLHSHSYKGNIIVGLLPRFLRPAPLLITLHGWRLPTTQLARLIQRVETLGIYRATAVVAVHESLAADSRLARLASDRLKVIHNGISQQLDQFNTIRSEPRFTNDRLAARIREFVRGRFSIAAVGRLSEEKGFDLLLRAIARLHGQDVRAVAVIFGEGNNRSHLERRVIELGLQDSVLMLGYIKRAKEYMPLFDALAIPSYAEGLPLVLLEAMSNAVPIVASDAGGIPAVLRDGECGRVFPVGNAEALSRELLKISADPLATCKMTVAARDEVSARYSSQHMGREYEQLYEELLRYQVAKGRLPVGVGRADNT